MDGKSTDSGGRRATKLMEEELHMERTPIFTQGQTAGKMRIQAGVGLI